MMMSYISMSRNTTDIGEITLPFESPALSKALGYILAVVYYTTVPLLVAAGGSFINQETGVGVMPGSLLIAFLAAAVAMFVDWRIYELNGELFEKSFIYPLVSACWGIAIYRYYRQFDVLE